MTKTLSDDLILDLIDPETALKQIPDKIKRIDEMISELALDFSVVQGIEGSSPEELAAIKSTLSARLAAKAAYQARLDAIKDATKKG